jgi:hypothetical protein
MNVRTKIEDFIEHDPHCLAGKYSTIGRCSCGAYEAAAELAALKARIRELEAAEYAIVWALGYTNFGENKPDNAPPYWWRSELRKLYPLTSKRIDAILAAALHQESK